MVATIITRPYSGFISVNHIEQTMMAVHEYTIINCSVPKVLLANAANWKPSSQLLEYE